VPYIAYVQKNFRPDALSMIERCNGIIASYHAQGYDLTLRQVFYQCVSRAWIANTSRSYNNLGALINDARLAGLIDWTAITDRTRNMRQNSHWDTPADIIASAASSYAIDKWEGQTYRVEVWVEKEALAGVVGRAALAMDVPYFCCRGYTSQSEMWSAAQRLLHWTREGYTPYIIHLGDHDPSGIDMSRDIEGRLALFTRGRVPFQRIALNMDQVEYYGPPPNPAKITDSRANEYVDAYGPSSWELDALEPAVIATLIADAVGALRDDTAWARREDAEDTHRALLGSAAAHWEEVTHAVRRATPRPILSPQEAGACGGRGRKRRDNVPTFARGNSRSYLLAALERDHRALYDQVIARQMSAYQAAVQAGIRRPHGSTARS